MLTKEKSPDVVTPIKCGACREGRAFALPISMAFQPIVDLQTRTIYAHEALVRGADGLGAGHVLAQVDEENRYAFDQACRIKAIEWFAHLGIAESVSINFMPNAVYQPEVCLRTTLATMQRLKVPCERVIFEVTEREAIADQKHLRNILRAYHDQGFRTAIDDFGAGYAGLNLLADFQPDLIKIDMALIRDIDHDRPRRLIVETILSLCEGLEIQVIAEGIETAAELQTLQAMDVRYAQGYLLARPAFQAINPVDWDIIEERFR